MCLSRLEFSLKYNKKLGEYVGLGFKAYDTQDDISGLRNWVQAAGDGVLSHSVTMTKDGEYYHPGFHIFLDYTAARNYFSVSTCKKIYLVKYHSPIAFGSNITYKYNVNYPCVIARYMRIVKEVTDDKDLSTMWSKARSAV